MPECRDIEPLVTAYVDGEASPAERTEVDAHLGACPPCRQHAEAEAAARHVLRERAGGLVEEAPPELVSACSRLAATARRGPLWRRAVPLAAAATLILATAVVVLRLASGSATVLAAQLTGDHVKCFELLPPGGGGARGESHGIEAAGVRVTVPTSLADGDLQMVAARTCLYANGPMPHVMYRLRGQPVSLFMLREAAEEDRNVEVMGHEVVMWTERGRTFLLIGRQSRKELEQLASALRARIH